MRKRFSLIKLNILAVLLIVAQASVVTASAGNSFFTEETPFITLADGLPQGASVKAIISSGDEIGSFLFEGLPDGIGIKPGAAKHTVDVYVVHENTTIPFFGSRDFQDASISRLTLNTKGGARQGEVLDADEVLGPEAGFLRFCSASMAGPAEGLSTYTFFTGEETNDTVGGSQHGLAVGLNTETGAYSAILGMGRLNHENTIVVPGGWDGFTLLTTDDTFSAPSAQLYLYHAATEADILGDGGSLYAFRVTGRNGVPLWDATDAFNGANDYLDLTVDDDFSGEFIPVPDAIADGDQDALEDWSNDNNVFQAIRLEDLAYDKNNPRVVYVADTGRTRIVPDPVTGRMTRGPGGTLGMADNGRIFQFVFNEDDPLKVDSVTVLADGDEYNSDVYVPFINPDNIDTSTKSLMVQEDNDDARIWQYRFNQGWWRVVATVNDSDGESSGIVDASEWFGQGVWLLDVQGHGANVAEDITSIPGTLIKRESGQLLMMKIPGS